MLMLKRTILTLAATAALAGAAHATPLDVKTVPAGAKWVVHVDVDTVVKSETWKLVEPKLAARPNYAKAKAKIEQIFKAKLPGDVHGVTLFGPTVGEKEAVIVINADVNVDRVKTLLSLADEYEEQAVGKQTVYGWKDEKGKQLYGVIPSGKVLIVGQSQDRVVEAAEVLSGSGKATDNLLMLPKDDAGLLVFVAGDELAKIAENGAQSPVVKKLQSGVLTATQVKDGLSLEGHVVAQDAATAEQILKAVDGIRSWVALGTQQDPKESLAAEALTNLTATRNGTAVDASCTVSMDVISELLELAADR